MELTSGTFSVSIQDILTNDTYGVGLLTEEQ
jgi:hypothetical protein